MTVIDLRQEFDSLVETSRTYQARSLVCWGSVGSGKSSLAVNLSFEVANLGMRVCLIDADTYHPSLAAILGQTDPGGGLAAAVRLARQDRFSEQDFQRLIKKIDFAGGSIWFLPGLNSSARWPEIDSVSLSALLRDLSGRFDLLLWDVATHTESSLIDAVSGRERNQTTNFLLAEADLLLASFVADPVGVNRFLFDVRSVSRSLWPIANRIRTSATGRNPIAQLRSILQSTADQTLRAEVWEDEGFDSMLQTTRPLLLQGRSSKAQQAIRKLAKEIITELER